MTLKIIHSTETDARARAIDRGRDRSRDREQARSALPLPEWAQAWIRADRDNRSARANPRGDVSLIKREGGRAYIARVAEGEFRTDKVALWALQSGTGISWKPLEDRRG